MTPTLFTVRNLGSKPQTFTLKIPNLDFNSPVSIPGQTFQTDSFVFSPVGFQLVERKSTQVTGFSSSCKNTNQHFALKKKTFTACTTMSWEMTTLAWITSATQTLVNQSMRSNYLYDKNIIITCCLQTCRITTWIHMYICFSDTFERTYSICNRSIICNVRNNIHCLWKQGKVMMPKNANG